MSAASLQVAASLPVAGSVAAARGAVPASGAGATMASAVDATATAPQLPLETAPVDAAPVTAAEAFAARAATDGTSTVSAIPTTAHTGLATPPPSPTSAGSIGGAVFALVLVIGLILLLSKLARRMPGLGGASAHPALRIVGSLALGPRDRLVVVEVGQTQLLLGVGAGGTRTLHTLDQPLPAAAAKSPPAFAQLLAQQFGKKP